MFKKNWNYNSLEGLDMNKLKDAYSNYNWVDNFNLTFDVPDENHAEAEAMVEVKQNLHDYITVYVDEVEKWILKKHGI